MIRCRLEPEGVGELAVTIVVRGERKTGCRLPLRGLSQQLCRHLPDFLPRAALRGAPGAPADRVEAGPGTGRRGVASQQVDPLDWHEQPAAGSVLQFQEILIVRPLRPGEAADAMFEVDDIVTRGELVERGNQRPDATRRRRAGGRPWPEDLRRGQREEAGSGVEKTGTQVSMDQRQRARVSVNPDGSNDRDIHPGFEEQVTHPLGFPERPGGNEDEPLRGEGHQAWPEDCKPLP